MFLIYVHHLDPVIIELFSGLKLRWYGLAYLLGFLAAYFLLKRLAEKKMWVVAPEKTADFIAACALLGVFVGGRLGYILFYQLPRDGWDALVNDPLVLFRVWEGGMASHGGIIGLGIYTFYYARKHRISWAGLSDGLCVVGPIGLFCGRMANFINGELYGRVVSQLPWAVKFPTAFHDPKAPEFSRFDEALSAAMEADSDFSNRISDISSLGYQSGQGSYIQELIDASRDSEAIRKAIEPFLEARHPSQIYEGLLEGLLIFGILWVVRNRYPQAPFGLITGLFFGLYAFFRIIAEIYREPDAAWIIEGFMTKGQFLSLFLFLFSALFLSCAYRNSKGKISS